MEEFGATPGERITGVTAGVILVLVGSIWFTSSAPAWKVVPVVALVGLALLLATAPFRTKVVVGGTDVEIVGLRHRRRVAYREIERVAIRGTRNRVVVLSLVEGSEVIVGPSSGPEWRQDAVADAIRSHL